MSREILNRLEGESCPGQPGSCHLGWLLPQARAQHGLACSTVRMNGI